MNFKSFIAPALLLAFAGCSSDENLTIPGQTETEGQGHQVANISYNVGNNGKVTFSAASGISEHKAAWQAFGLITNDIQIGGQEHMECAAAVRNSLKVLGQWGSFTNSPANYIAMKESTVLEGIGESFNWGGATIDRNWTDDDFDPAFAYAEKIVDYALANMDENGVYTCEINGETYTYKLLDTDLQWCCPVGTQLGEYGREFADEKRDNGNKVTYIVTRDIFVEGSFVSGNVYAPNATITMRTGGTITGQVICNKFVVDCDWACEIHNPNSDVKGTTPDPNPGEGGKDPEPGPTPDDPEPTPDQPYEVKIPIDLKSEYVVQPDDFAIHNGDMLYIDIANGDTDPSFQTATSKPYLLVTLGENPVINIDNVAEMYKEYANKTTLCNDPKSPYYGQQVPYVSTDGIFTLEVYLWPGKKVNDEDGNVKIEPLTYTEFGFSSLAQAIDGCYLMGTAQNGEVISKPGDDYKITVSAFKAIQGAGNTPYVHVSIHIKPLDE